MKQEGSGYTSAASFAFSISAARLFGRKTLAATR
jgi:hypothetical protein